MPQTKPIVSIENVVASATVSQTVNLNLITQIFPDVEYHPDQFPGLVFRLKSPKTATLIFSSGKMVCTGAKSEDQAIKAVKNVVQKLKKGGISIEHEPIIEIQNIVASADLGTVLNLNAIAIGLGLENIEYEPEQFPGLVYRLSSPKVVMLLFGSGKLVVMGGKRPEDAEAAVEKIVEELDGLGLL